MGFNIDSTKCRKCMETLGDFDNCDCDQIEDERDGSLISTKDLSDMED